MKYLAGPQVADLVEHLIKADVQQHDYETDLTIAAVYRLTGPGAIDFGGSEARRAPREEIAAHKVAPEEKYGWWDLGPGTWIIRFNEVPRLGTSHIAFVQPHERLVEAGATHPSFWFRGTRDAVETLLSVGPGGVRIKQNARASKLLIVELQG